MDTVSLNDVIWLDREAQINRPAFKGDLDLTIGYLPFNTLKKHCDSMCTLADSHEVLKKIARFEF